MTDSDQKQETAAIASGEAMTGSPIRPMREYLTHALRAAVEEREEQSDEAELDIPLEAEALLRDAVRENATDLHLDTKADGLLVRMRVDGRVLDGAILTHEQGARLVNQFKAMARLSPITRYLPEEGRTTYELEDQVLDLRLTHVPCLRGDKLSIRVLTLSMVSHQLNELGLCENGLEHIHEWLDNISGMFLVAGPTGSGKTTTLYALLHRLKLYERNVITIEDPVEYEVDGINHMQIDERHGLGFSEGVKAMLHLDPDYMMLGEIRDKASAHAAITAATSGHALMSTLHSRDAVGVIDTLHHYGLSGSEISAGLILVIAQRLVRRVCLHCREEVAPSQEEVSWLASLGRKAPDRVWHANGCSHCKGSGYHGRIGVFEIWRIDSDEYQLILADTDRRTLYQHLARRGHRFMLDDGLDKVEQGVTTLSELRSMGGYSVLGAIDKQKRKKSKRQKKS